MITKKALITFGTIRAHLIFVTSELGITFTGEKMEVWRVLIQGQMFNPHRLGILDIRTMKSL